MHAWHGYIGLRALSDAEQVGEHPEGGNMSGMLGSGACVHDIEVIISNAGQMGGHLGHVLLSSMQGCRSRGMVRGVWVVWGAGLTAIEAEPSEGQVWCGRSRGLVTAAQQYPGWASPTGWSQRIPDSRCMDSIGPTCQRPVRNTPDDMLAASEAAQLCVHPWGE